MKPKHLTALNPLVPALYVILLIPGVLLLLTASTARGRWTGLLCLLFLAAFGGLCGFDRHPIGSTLSTIGLLGIAAMLWIRLSGLAESGKSLAGESVGSEFLGSVRYPRWYPSNFPPERDQVGLPLALLTSLSPFMNRQQAREMRATVRKLYDEMDARPEWRAVGSVLPLGLHALVLGPWLQEHYFFYTPPGADDGFEGALIFLHGAGGNIKLAMWAMKDWADRSRMVLVCPSFGLGNWESRRAVPWVGRVRAQVLQRWTIPSDRIYLAGLSQGGAGVSRVIREQGQMYAGFVYISAVMEAKILADPRFTAQCRDRPILVLQGERDVQVRPGPVMAAVNQLTGQGLNVTCRTEPNADHFLLFGCRHQVRDWLTDWIGNRKPETDRHYSS
jgi:pimeloyl-ACP methyl ester carboxylesterase